jgi:hypothetical protein
LPLAGHGFRYSALAGDCRAITLATAAINAAEPLVLKYIFDELAAHRTLRPLVVGIGILLGLGVVREVAGAGSNWLTWKTRIGVHYGLLDAMIRRKCIPFSISRNISETGPMRAPCQSSAGRANSKMSGSITRARRDRF